MLTPIIAIVIFLDILYYLIIFDVILSWLMLAGINFRPNFIKQILGPIYKCIKTYIPTQIGAFELTPIICLMLILFCQGIILNMFPEVGVIIKNISN